MRDFCWLLCMESSRAWIFSLQPDDLPNTSKLWKKMFGKWNRKHWSLGLANYTDLGRGLSFFISGTIEWASIFQHAVHSTKIPSWNGVILHACAIKTVLLSACWFRDTNCCIIIWTGHLHWAVRVKIWQGWESLAIQCPIAPMCWHL